MTESAKPTEARGEHGPRGWVLTQFAKLEMQTGGREVPKSCTLFFTRPGIGDDNPGITEYAPLSELLAERSALEIAKAETRLANTVIEQLQRAQKAHDVIRDTENAAIKARVQVFEEALEQLSIGHGVPLAAAMASPPERYRIMAKELNEMLRERTEFAREALAAGKEPE